MAWIGFTWMTAESPLASFGEEKLNVSNSTEDGEIIHYSNGYQLLMND